MCCQVICWSCQALTLLLCVQAVEAGRLDVAQKLIDFGVQLNVFDANRNTPLHLAVKLKVQLHLAAPQTCTCVFQFEGATISSQAHEHCKCGRHLESLHQFSSHKFLDR